MRNIPETQALQKISELAKTLQALTAAAIADLGEGSDETAEMLVGIRELSGVIGWTCERYGAGIFDADSFLVLSYSVEHLAGDK